MVFCKDFGKTNIYIKSTGIGIIVKLFFNVLLIPIKGIYEKGAIISTIISDIVICFLLIYKLIKELKIEIILMTKILKICLSIFISILLVFKLNVYFIIKIIILLLIYTFMIFVIKVFSEEEIKSLPNGEKIYTFMKKIKIY